MKRILEDVLQKIKPDKEEQKELSKASERLIERAREASSDFEVTVEPELVGSSARGTWLSEERDIDLFLLFPKDISRKKLEEIGLEIGKKITEGGGTEQYAEHPYINAKIDGFDVDIVPCYDIDDPTNLKSAVDRSPHHQEYIETWLTPDRADQVLLLKKFLMGIGAYGSELKIHGFSGYLCELLIVRYETFAQLIESASDWGQKKIITFGDERDREDLEKMFPNQPLIFVDPVDPGRNVAAAVTKRNYAIFIRASQNFIHEPRKEFFFPKEPPSRPEDLRKLIESRGSKIYMVSLKIPFDLVPDIIYPQLRKTERTLTKRLEEDKFEVLRSDVWGKDHRAIILIEVEVPELPAVRKHIGPPLGVDPEPFIQKHLKSEKKFAGPFINDDGRLAFELERKRVLAKQVLENAMSSLEGLGTHIEKSVGEEGFEILENKKVLDGAEELDALRFLGDYLTRCLPWYR